MIELDGMETINTGLKNTRIHGEEDMSVDIPPEPPVSRTLEAKRKALSQFVGFIFADFILVMSLHIPLGAFDWSSDHRDTEPPRGHRFGAPGLYPR